MRQSKMTQIFARQQPLSPPDNETRSLENLSPFTLSHFFY